MDAGESAKPRGRSPCSLHGEGEWELDKAWHVRLNDSMRLGVTNGVTTLEADSREELALERGQVQARLGQLDKRLSPLIATMALKAEAGFPDGEELLNKAERLRLQETMLVERRDLLDFALSAADPAPGGRLPKGTWQPTQENPF